MAPIVSAIVFMPQSRAPTVEYLDQIRNFMLQSTILQPLLKAVLDLKQAWNSLAEQKDDIAALTQGPRYLRMLSNWLINGDSGPIAAATSSIVSLPLLVVIQCVQFFQYLEVTKLRHAELIKQLQDCGGIQGYCGGLPLAIAIAYSKDEEDVVRNVAAVLRIVLAIGAYAELGDDASIAGSTTIVVRIKNENQGEELVRKFPGSYISAITDPKSISIVGSVSVLQSLQTYAEGLGLLVQTIHIRGKVHNPENEPFVDEICQLCVRTPLFHMPNVSTMLSPVRSNKTGELLAIDKMVSERLTEEIVSTILASRCEWFTLVSKLAVDIYTSGRSENTMLSFGIGDCVPLAPFHNLKVRLLKVDALQYIQQNFVKAALKSTEISTTYQYPKNAVAIIGASCRLPGANNLDELWQLISDGIDMHTELQSDRFDLRASFRAQQSNKFVDGRKFYGNFVDNIEDFDHGFFGVNPKEALNMDPQQRILLQLSYEAMESSGYRRQSGDAIGCFIGGSFVEYLDNTNAHAPTAYTSTGTIRAFLPGRISSYFDWTGPSEVIDTACSSSLVAINRGVKALLTGECRVSLAGGINLITGMNNFFDLAKAGFLSPTGQCKPFDQSADGYCRSDGAGLVVLKLLTEATKDGDHILGVIPGVATNQGGPCASITIPYKPSQKSLYSNVLQQAGMQSDDISYVEAHGTGTQAGDPIEMAGIREVFGSVSRHHVLHVGSVKGNIGHSETAAGIAGLLKVLAMLKHGQISPQANYKVLNPSIPALIPDQMAIAPKLESWNVPFRAAVVNSYGAAGTNCALICCEAPKPTKTTKQTHDNDQNEMVYPIMISAFSRESLARNIRTLASFLANTTSKPSMGQLAFTLNHCRERHKMYTTRIAGNVTEFINDLQVSSYIPLELPKTRRRIVLAFAGQSKQNVGLDRKIYQSSPRFRYYIDLCNETLQDLGYPSILPEIFHDQPILDVVLLQTSTFAMQYACAKTWIDSGLQIDAIIGHSFGELTALVFSGMLSLRDGLKLIARRAHLIDSMWGPERGSMLAVHTSREKVENIIKCATLGHTDVKPEIACYNSSTTQIVVGTKTSIAGIESFIRSEIQQETIKCQNVDTSHGFHSRFVDPILRGLREETVSLDWKVGDVYLETCTEQSRSSLLLFDPAKHAREPVFFQAAVQRLEERLGAITWVEAGINTPIIAMIKKAVVSPEAHSFHSISSKGSDSILGNIADVNINLWANGICCSDWLSLSENKTWLPTYQFQKSPHWLENVDRAAEIQKKLNKANVQTQAEDIRQQPKLVVPIGDSFTEFEVSVSCGRFQEIVTGHSVCQRPLCPASLYMEAAAMSLHLSQANFEGGSLFFEDLEFQSPLGVDTGRKVLLTLIEKTKTSWSFTVNSVQNNDTKQKVVKHCYGNIGIVSNTNLGPFERLVSDQARDLARNNDMEKLNSNRAYRLFSNVVTYETFFRGISNISMGERQALATIKIPSSQPKLEESTVTHLCDTVSIDNFIQVAGLLMNSSEMVNEDEVMVATGIETVSIAASTRFDCDVWKVYAKFSPIGDSQAVGDVFVFTSTDKLALTIMGCRFNKLLITRLQKVLDTVIPESVSTITATTKSPPSDVVLTPQGTSSSGLSAGMASPSTSNISNSQNDAFIAPSQSELLSSLKIIIATYTGIAEIDLPGTDTMCDLGVDSLAAVEMAEEISTKFGREISSDDLQECSLEDLTRLMVPEDQLSEQVNEALAVLASSKPISAEKIEESILGSEPAVKHNTDSRGTLCSLSQYGDALFRASEHFVKAAGERGYSNYWSRVAPSQDTLLIAYILEAFVELGVDIRNIESGRIIAFGGYLPKHEKVMERLLDILKKHRVLEQRETTLVRGDKILCPQSSTSLYADFVFQYPKYRGEADLMGLTGPKLGECLKGTTDPIGLLFGTARSSKVMEEYYTNSPMLSTMTQVMVAFLSKLTTGNMHAADARLRILEVGGGFGGTTSHLVNLLHRSGINVEYTFTDIAPRLVQKAKAKFAEYSWMDFQSLNLEKDFPASMLDRFDIVIGTNCVHATSSRLSSLRRIYKTLREGGIVILSEVTQLIDWYDITFGLLDGWWLAKNGEYPLQPAETWMSDMKSVGFGSSAYSTGSSLEANTQRLLVGLKLELPVSNEATGAITTSKPWTVAYKVVDGLEVLADIFTPQELFEKALPVVLMVHGGGHMTLSRKAIRNAQTSYLLDRGILVISLDYRLCPEISVCDGPITDVRDAYAWAQIELPLIMRAKGVSINGKKIAVMGWSTGGHLAMTTGWTTRALNLKPPCAILSFYGPTDFESGDLDVRRAKSLPERQMSLARIIRSLPTKPITTYTASGTDSTKLGWIRPGDPRSELILSLFKEGTGLPLLLYGLPYVATLSDHTSPEDDAQCVARWLSAPISSDLVASISPMAQLRLGHYDTPTFMIHGEKDEIVPYGTAQRFVSEMKERGVECGFLTVKDGVHIHDLELHEGTTAWEEGVGPGLDFLVEKLHG